MTIRIGLKFQCEIRHISDRSGFIRSSYTTMECHVHVCDDETQTKWHFRFLFCSVVVFLSHSFFFSEVRLTKSNRISMHCIAFNELCAFFSINCHTNCDHAYGTQRRVKWCGKLSYNFSNHNAKLTFNQRWTRSDTYWIYKLPQSNEPKKEKQQHSIAFDLECQSEWDMKYCTWTRHNKKRWLVVGAWTRDISLATTTKSNRNEIILRKNY